MEAGRVSRTNARRWGVSDAVQVADKQVRYWVSRCKKGDVGLLLWCDVDGGVKELMKEKGLGEIIWW